MGREGYARRVQRVFTRVKPTSRHNDCRARSGLVQPGIRIRLVVVVALDSVCGQVELEGHLVSHDGRVQVAPGHLPILDRPHDSCLGSATDWMEGTRGLELDVWSQS